MFARKLGINMHFSDSISQLEALELIAKVGFESTFTPEYDTDKVRELKAKADSLGIFFETIHAPFDNVNDIWTQKEGEPDILTRMKKAVCAAAENGIPIVIIHLSAGWNPPGINDLGLARFDSLVEFAANRGVKIAFENLRVLGNVAYFTDRYRNCENVGFCFDAGHEHCNTKTISWIDIFANQLITTHIHDNFSRGDALVENADSHRLPFDGTYDYEGMMHRLDKHSYSGTLMLEVFMRRSEEYMKMSCEEFLREAYSRVQRIATIH